MAVLSPVLCACSDKLDYKHIKGFSVSCTTETGGYLSLNFSAYKIDGWQSANLEIIGDDDNVFGDWSATDFIATYNQISFISTDESPKLFTMTRQFPKDRSPPSKWAGLLRHDSDETGVMKELRATCDEPFYDEKY